MPYDHIAGPLDGQNLKACDPDYRPVTTLSEPGTHPNLHQDAIWKQARIVSARVKTGRTELQLDVGQGIRTLKDRDGKPSHRIGKQVVVTISPEGIVTLDRPGEWQGSMHPQVIEFSDMEVLSTETDDAGAGEETQPQASSK